MSRSNSIVNQRCGRSLRNSLEYSSPGRRSIGQRVSRSTRKFISKFITIAAFQKFRLKIRIKIIQIARKASAVENWKEFSGPADWVLAYLKVYSPVRTISSCSSQTKDLLSGPHIGTTGTVRKSLLEHAPSALRSSKRF